MMNCEDLEGSGISLTLILQRNLPVLTQENHEKP